MKGNTRKALAVVAAIALSSMAHGALAARADGAPEKSAKEAPIGINVLLTAAPGRDEMKSLRVFGAVTGQLAEIDAVFMRAPESALDSIRALPFVKAANPDAERLGAPVDTVAAEDFADGLSTWDLDVINVTDFGFDNRQVAYDGTGVYVAVLDTGLLDSWRRYFPEERIAEEYARSFGGGGALDAGSTPTQPNKWEHDTNSHGTHVTSTILGYSLDGTPINGVAPMATVIPVKVLNNNGSGWSSVIAAGIDYVTSLKEGPLAGRPVVINMSLGGSRLDAVEQAAIDAAVSAGVIIVASAGNSGTRGMGYPGAYGPVISVAAAGATDQWTNTQGSWWWALNIPEPTEQGHVYIASFSSRQLSGQDLDVTAPGAWVVGPYQINRGQTSYYYLSGTSMASPHVAGIVALMAQKNGALTAADAESYLEGSAITIDPGCRTVMTPSGSAEYCWGSDATGAGLATADAALAATP